MKRSYRFSLAAVAVISCLPIFALGANLDAPPAPPSSVPVDTNTTTTTTTTVVLPTLPTGTTTTTQTDGSVVATMPQVTVEGGQTSTTKITITPAKTTALAVSVAKFGAAAVTTSINVSVDSTTTVQTDGTVVAVTKGANPTTVSLRPTGATSASVATSTQTNAVALPRGAQATVGDGSFQASTSIAIAGSKSASVTASIASTGSSLAVNTGATNVTLSSYSAAKNTTMSLVKLIKPVVAKAIRDDLTTDASVQEVNTSIGDETYDAILSRFTSERMFVVSERIERSLTLTGKKIEITPSTAALFEEVVSFDGTRTIKLTSGSAKITIDGVDSNMSVGTLYNVPSKRLEEVLASVAKHTAGKLTLNKRWNIVTPPAPCKVYATMFNSVASTSAGGNKLAYVYKLGGGGYETIGYTGAVSPGQGVYIKVDDTKELDFSFLVPDTTFNFAAFYSTVGDYGGWKLLGAPIALSAKAILDSGAQKFISMQGNAWSSWYDNTLLDASSIVLDAGTGFWIQK